MEKLKSIPVPIWIGLGLILILMFVMNGKSAKQSAPPVTAPVTDQTVGSQGSQSGAGTDQQLGNLSVLTQGGISQIQQQQQADHELLMQLQNGMNGVGTPMQQFGGSIQKSQNGYAQHKALSDLQPGEVTAWV